jgi:hypothetical protein
MTDMQQTASTAGPSTRGKVLLRILAGVALLCPAFAQTQKFFPLRDIRAGMHGVGRTVFEGNRVEEFQVEILGVLENVAPKQSIILARLSGGPLERVGVLQGMSGSPVYIDGRLAGAVALGFPFSKEPIAGIQPIEQMITESHIGTGLTGAQKGSQSALFSAKQPSGADTDSRSAVSMDTLTNILTPVSFSGFSPGTLSAFASEFRKLGFQPQQGVSGGSPKSQDLSGTVSPGSMISVQLVSGDMSVSADGTVTYVDGKQVYAFGHRFLTGGDTELPFASARVVTLLPTLNSSFKISAPEHWVGTITEDRSTAVAGEIGKRAHTIPLAVRVHSPTTGLHDYHVQVVNDRLLTPFLTQTVLFSALDATERSLGAASLQLRGTVRFDGNLPPLEIADTFASDNALPQQASANAAVSLGFVLGAGFSNLHIKDMSFDLQPVETKRQMQITDVWADKQAVRPGDSVEITAQLAGENGTELTRTASYRVPIGAPNGPLNFTVSDANTLNYPDFAGLNPTSLHSPEKLIETIDSFRTSGAAYVRVWRQQPAFTVSPLPGGELTDPPPSAALILAAPSASVGSSASQALTRGSQLAEIPLTVGDYVVSGAKTVQVEVKE